MNVTFENLINVWDAQIPNLLVELVNHAVFATDKAGFQAVVTKLSETTDFDKFFAYGWIRQTTFLAEATPCLRPFQIHG